MGKKIFLKHDFEVVDKAQPKFSLVAKIFDDFSTPAFPTNWEERQASFGEGLTVVYANQCPYFHTAVQETLNTAEEVGIEPRQAVELKNAQEVQDQAPCPYGTFGIIYEGALLTCTPLTTKKLKKRLLELRVDGNAND